MSYSVAVTRTGQMTLPKVLREKFGITNRAQIDVVNDELVVRREPTLSEGLQKLYDSYSEDTKAAFKRMAGKSIEQLKNEWAESPEGKAYFKEKYGL